MKKLLCLLVAVCMILSVAGCALLRYEFMEVEDMVELPDDEMTVALLMQLGEQDFSSLNEAQKVVYTAAALELEVLNGGVVQFLSNEGNRGAPYVLEALEKLGATEHLALLQETLTQNGVELTDLSAFITQDVEAFSKLYDQYDFDAFEHAYETLPSIPEYIRAYIRAHEADF